MAATVEALPLLPPVIAARRRLETWLLVIPLLILALVGGNISMASLPAHIAFVALALVAAAIMLLAVLRPKSADGRAMPLLSSLDAGWLLLLAATLLAVLFNDPRHSIEFWLFPLALQLPFFYAVVALQRRDWAVASWLRAWFVVIGGLCVEALIAAIVFYGQIASLRPPSQDVVPIPFRLYAVLNNPNVFGVVLAMTVPLAIGYGIWTRRRWERIAVGALLLGLGWALLATGSRGSQLAAVAGSAVTLLAVGIARGWLQTIRVDRRVRFTAAVLVLVAIGGIGAVVLVETRASGRAGSETRHFDLWQIAIHAGLVKPLFGAGPGGFPLAQLQSVSVPPTPVERHAHNLFLNFFAENGLFGSLALLFWLILLASAIWRAWQAADINNRLWIGGLTGGIIAFGAAGLLDDPLAQMAPLSLLTLFVALIGSVAPLAEPAAQRGTKFISWLMLIIAMFICLTAIAFTARYATVWNAAQSSPNNSAQSWTDTAQTLDRAAAADPGDSLTVAQAAVAWVEVASSTQGEAQTAALNSAIADYQQLVRADPAFAVQHLNLGVLLLERGSLEAAIAELAEAVRRAPASGIAHLNYAVALEKQGGGTTLTVFEYKQALTFGVGHEALFWQATATRRSIPVVAATDSFIDDTPHALASGLAALARGDAAGARYEFTAAITLDGFDAATAALIALGDLDAAQGNQSGALEEYRAAFSRIDRYGVLGPGHSGDQSYAVNVFNRFAYISDYVPGVLTLDISPDRAARFVTLARALSSAGDYAAAAHIYRRILVDNPGYSAAQSGLAQLGNAATP